MKTFKQRKLEKQQKLEEQKRREEELKKRYLIEYGTSDYEEVKKIVEAFVCDRDNRVINYELEHNKFFAEDVKKHGHYYAWNALSKYSVIKHSCREEIYSKTGKSLSLDLTRRLEDKILKEQIIERGFNTHQVEIILKGIGRFRGEYFYESLNLTDYVIDDSTLDVGIKLPKYRLQDLIKRDPGVIERHKLNVQSYENFDFTM